METTAEEIARLRREIGERQARLQFLVLGDPRIGVCIGQEKTLAEHITEICERDRDPLR